MIGPCPGVLSGESLDVNTVVREFDASEAAAEALLAWEIELDKTLIERDNTMMEIDLDALVATLENDDKAARDAARSESKVRRDVRDANLEAIDSIAELMGEQANDFRLAAWQKAFPRVYRETMFQRTIRAVRDMEGVDPLVLETLDRLEADFLVQLADIQEEARQAMVKQEEGQFERRFEQMRERMEGNGRRPEREETELDEVMAQLRELETESRETLEQMLTEEQIAQLPRGNRQRGVSVNAEKVAVICDSKSLNALMPMEMVNWMPQSERLPCEKCEIAAMVNEAYAKNTTSSGANQSPATFAAGAFLLDLSGPSYSSEMPRRDEGPSPDDLRRFGEEADTTGYCPECGAEVYDDADACPKCFAWITGRTLHKPPEDLALQKKVRQVIVFITLLTMFPIVLRLLGIL